MKKKYIAGNYPDLYTAGGKAKIDAEDIVRQLNYVNGGANRGKYRDKSVQVKLRYLYSRLKLWLNIGRGDILFFQFPSTKHYKTALFAKNRGCKIIMLVHDLNSLRGKIVKTEQLCLELADVLIVHTEQMKEWLISKGLKKDYVVLDIFDYLNATKGPEPLDYNDIRIAFAGNLGKSLFLDKLVLNNVTLELFGIGIDQRTLQKGLTYKGTFSPEDLANHMKVHYGLVWDGDSIDTCEGPLGSYLKLIASHKLSMYLSAGIPVIVWEESAMAAFVKRHGVGVAIKGLRELDQLPKLISADKYEGMRNNTKEISKFLSEGKFLKKAVVEAEKFLIEDNV